MADPITIINSPKDLSHHWTMMTNTMSYSLRIKTQKDCNTETLSDAWLLQQLKHCRNHIGMKKYMIMYDK